MFHLASVTLVNASPLDHPLRTAAFSVPVIAFSYWSLRFFRSLHKGATIIFHPQNPVFTFRVVPGRYSLTSSQKKRGFKSSFNSPASSAFLGLLFFAAAEFLLVLLFKNMEYTFLV